MKKRKLATRDIHNSRLADIVGGERAILYKKEDLIAYDCDGFTIITLCLKAVVFPKIRRK